MHPAVLYLIEILHQTTTRQPPYSALLGCILSKFYIKPQRIFLSFFIQLCCILSKFYIKPQRTKPPHHLLFVVSYRNSTSNHNTPAAVLGSSGLYLIEILHQTTTLKHQSWKRHRCILSKFYIKPQRQMPFNEKGEGCILSKFYIKPQLVPDESDAPSSCILSKFYIKPQPYIQR